MASLNMSMHRNGGTVKSQSCDDMTIVQPYRYMGMSAEFVRSVLDYDPETGEFRWKYRPDKSPRWNERFAGQIAGSITKDSATRFYLLICIDGIACAAHRLAWFYVKGEWPPGRLDHRDGDGLNNPFDNLRLATCSQNGANRGPTKRNALGVKGVWSKPNGKFGARIGHKGKAHYLGTHDTVEEAQAAYAKAAERLFGEFARTE